MADIDEFEEDLEDEEPIPHRPARLSPELELQYRLELQNYQRLQQANLNKDVRRVKKKGKRKDYNPFTYLCILIGVVAITIFLIIASMGYPKIGILYAAFILFLSLFMLTIVWILCYFKLAFLGYIIFGIQCLVGALLLILAIIKYDDIKTELNNQNQNSN